MSARQRHERIEGWSATVVALYLDRGVIDQWPFELTRHGRWVERQQRRYGEIDRDSMIATESTQRS